MTCNLLVTILGGKISDSSRLAVHIVQLSLVVLTAVFLIMIVRHRVLFGIVGLAAAALLFAASTVQSSRLTRKQSRLQEKSLSTSQ
jgi:hypothetical protein